MLSFIPSWIFISKSILRGWECGGKTFKLTHTPVLTSAALSFSILASWILVCPCLRSSFRHLCFLASYDNTVPPSSVSHQAEIEHEIMITYAHFNVTPPFACCCCWRLGLLQKVSFRWRGRGGVGLTFRSLLCVCTSAFGYQFGWDVDSSLWGVVLTRNGVGIVFIFRGISRGEVWEEKLELIEI